ncbi:MAG: amidase [Proteobacteria bacterium]|nr:amidase [Pseudomonadota bacterium]
MVDTVKVGILFSCTGPYAAIGRDCRDGAALAFDEAAQKSGGAISFEPVYTDPEGEPRAYLEQARAMLRDAGCRHIIGTITSLARKEVIPLIEKHDGLLWYICPYEGFEANENVIYTGTCPNQHLMPLFEHLLPRQGRRVFLLGANYVWGWEMNRIARDLLRDAGGEVVGERYLPIEETDVERLIADIQSRRPDFILNNLIGPSSHAFLRAYKALGDADPAFRPEVRPVVSCDLTEAEIGEIGLGLSTGHLSVASYFGTLATPENERFRARAAAAFGPGRRLSSFVEGAYVAVHMLMDAVRSAGSDEPAAVRSAIHASLFETPHGPMRIDPRTNHAALPFHLGRIRDDGDFDIIASRPAIAADPYMTASRDGGRSSLRVVS